MVSAFDQYVFGNKKIQFSFAGRKKISENLRF